MKRFLLPLLFAALLSTPLFADGSFQRTFQVSGPVDLDVSTRSGNITVHTGSASTVIISATIRPSNSWLGLSGNSESEIRDIEQHPPVSRSGNNIRIENIPEHMNISISYDITTPPQTSLHAHSGSGTLAASSLRAPLDAKTGSGNIRLDDIDGNVNVSTGSGSIEADKVNGAVQARTGSGSVHMNLGGKGDVQASTGSGTISLDGVNGAVEAKTGSGNIEIAGTQKGDWRFSTGSGSVRLRVPSDSAFDVDAHTGSGRVYVQRPVTMQGDVSEASRGKTVMGKVNGGGPLLHVRTGSGNITIE